jgi:hypothetical protein
MGRTRRAVDGNAKVAVIIVRVLLALNAGISGAL